jgi:antitoxin HicB
MDRSYVYEALLEPGDEGAIVVTFPDVPEAITEGDTRADALTMAEDALGVALLAYADLKRPLPEARDHGLMPIAVAADVAAKLAVIEAFTASGLTKSDLARRLGVHESEVRRILNPRHATKLQRLVQTLRALGHRLVVRTEAA